MFNAVYINFAECYGPEGSLPLRQALEELLGTEDVSTYRNDGFVTVHCPVTDESYFLYDGCAVTRGPDGRVVVLEDIEAFKQEVSDAVGGFMLAFSNGSNCLPSISHLIIPATKPDPLVEALKETYGASLVDADALRTALEARGLEIREKGQ
jgi:hypothetical protein